jgi:rod shape-determining protein MreD
MKEVRSFTIFFLVAVSGLIIQSSFKFYLPALRYFCPQLLFILVVFLSFQDSSAKGVLCSFFLGLVLDISSGMVIGPWAGAYTVSYTAVALLSQGIFADSAFAVIVSTFVSYLISGLIFVLLSFSFTGGSTSAMLGILIEAFTTALVAPLVFPLLKVLLKNSRLSRRGSSF